MLCHPGSDSALLNKGDTAPNGHLESIGGRCDGKKQKGGPKDSNDGLSSVIHPHSIFKFLVLYLFSVKM